MLVLLKATTVHDFVEISNDLWTFLTCSLLLLVYIEAKWRMHSVVSLVSETSPPFYLQRLFSSKFCAVFPYHTHILSSQYTVMDPNFIGLHQSFGIFSRVKTCWFPINLYGKQNVICLKLALNTGVYMSLVKLHQMFVVFKIHETNFTHGLWLLRSSCCSSRRVEPYE